MSERPTLSVRPPKLTPQQEARALLAGRLAAGANVLLAGGLITREKHTAIFRMLAPDVQPVIDAMIAEHRAAQGTEARRAETVQQGSVHDGPVRHSEATADAPEASSQSLPHTEGGDPR